MPHLCWCPFPMHDVALDEYMCGPCCMDKVVDRSGNVPFVPSGRVGCCDLWRKPCQPSQFACLEQLEFYENMAFRTRHEQTQDGNPTLVYSSFNVCSAKSPWAGWIKPI